MRGCLSLQRHLLDIFLLRLCHHGVFGTFSTSVVYDVDGCVHPSLLPRSFVFVALLHSDRHVHVVIETQTKLSLSYPDFQRLNYAMNIPILPYLIKYLYFSASFCFDVGIGCAVPVYIGKITQICVFVLQRAPSLETVS
jgi:hypothetical protein